MLPFYYTSALDAAAVIKGDTTPATVAGTTSVTDTELVANVTAAAFDVKLRYFALGAAFNTLTIADNYPIGGYPNGWAVSPDEIVIPASQSWVEVTGDIKFDGSFDYKWDDSVINWSTTLKGINYNASYYAPGRALLCMRKVTFEGYDSSWHIWWLGCVDTGGWQDNYKHGMEWQRTIKGVDGSLKTTDSPRLVIGQTNLAAEASVSVSSTLSVPEEEIGYNEFVGSTAVVDSNNINDERLNTVWIAQYPPSVVEETLPISHVEATDIVIDEVFFMPVTGYDPLKNWWIEVVSLSDGNAGDGLTFAPGTWADGWLATYNADGIPVAVHLKGGDKLKRGERAIICANKKLFEEYTGGANSAQFVIETDTLTECYRITGYTLDQNPSADYYEWSMDLDTSVRMPFTLNINAGYIYFTPYHYQSFSNGDCVKWGAISEAFPPNTRAHELWTGNPVDITTLATGQSIRRWPTGGGVQTGYGSNNYDSNTAADWIIGTYPKPGDKYSANQFEWALLELPEHTSTLTTAIVAGANTMTFDEGIAGWPPNGEGIIEADVFSYVRSGSSLDSITGLDNDHAVGAQAYPYVNTLAQTGWSISTIGVKRTPGLAYIKRATLYTSPYASATQPDGYDPTAIDWQTSYEQPGLEYSSAGSGTANIYFEMAGRWARSVLLCIHEMFPNSGTATGARAKINEAYIYPDDLTVNNELTLATTPTGGTQSIAAEVIRYLLANYSWLTEADIRDDTYSNWGFVHSFSTAITPITRVIADIARAHGCVVHYHPAGQILIERDPWWPGGLDQAQYYYVGGTNYGALYTFGLNSARGDFELENAQPDITGVAILATDAAGNPIERYTYPAGATGSTVKEVTDITVVSSSQVAPMAQKLWYKESDTRRVKFVVKGPGEWLRPGFILFLDWNSEVTNVTWIIEEVNYTWRKDSGGKSWQALVTCRAMPVV